MVEKKKNEKINIYEMAGKVGKGIKKCSGVVLGIVGTIVIQKAPEIIKRIKK